MKTIKILAFLTIALVATQAKAVVITFEGFNNAIYTAPITRSGFNIGNVTGDIQHFHEITSTGFGLPNNGTGVLLNDRNSRIFVEESASAAFSLTSVDVAASLGSNQPAHGIQIEGFLNNISTGIVTLGVLGNGYTTLLGSVLGNVDRIVFDGLGGQGGFILDNLSLNEAGPGPSPVPVPASLLLLGIGLAGIGFSKRKVR